MVDFGAHHATPKRLRPPVWRCLQLAHLVWGQGCSHFLLLRPRPLGGNHPFGNSQTQKPGMRWNTKDDSWIHLPEVSPKSWKTQLLKKTRDTTWRWLIVMLQSCFFTLSITPRHDSRHDSKKGGWLSWQQSCVSQSDSYLDNYLFFSYQYFGMNIHTSSINHS